MGVPSLMKIFDEKYYLNLEGGILEALGRTSKSGLKLYVYPMIDGKTSELVTATKLEVAPNLRSLSRSTWSKTSSSRKSPIMIRSICAFIHQTRSRN